MVGIDKLKEYLGNFNANYVINSAFVVRMDDFVEHSLADYWIFGHTHYSGGSALIGKTQLICNQLGYIQYGENKAFNPKACFEI